MPKLMTQRDVAKALGISADRVREYTRAGLIEHVTLPGFRKPKYTVEGGKVYRRKDAACRGAGYRLICIGGEIQISI